MLNQLVLAEHTKYTIYLSIGYLKRVYWKGALHTQICTPCTFLFIIICEKRSDKIEYAYNDNEKDMCYL